MKERLKRVKAELDIKKEEPSTVSVSFCMIDTHTYAGVCAAISLLSDLYRQRRALPQQAQADGSSAHRASQVSLKL